MIPAGIANELRRMFPLRWDMERRYRLPSGDMDQPYYIQWSAAAKPHGEGWIGAEYDANGVILNQGDYVPVEIAQFALHEYARFCDSEDHEARRRFFAQADYLAANQRTDGAYPYSMPLSIYDVAPGWISGMAQGEAASVLLRAYALSGDDRYRECGLSALEPLKRDTLAGGASYVRGGRTFFEEVASHEPCHILNGHLYAAFAIWEYVTCSLGGDDLRGLHENAIATLEAWLPRYDEQGWSCYDLARDEYGRRHLAPLWYHQFHIAQLHVYSEMTGRAAFHAMSERWRNALSNPRIRVSVWKYHSESLVREVGRRIARKPRAPFRAIAVRD